MHCKPANKPLVFALVNQLANASQSIKVNKRKIKERAGLVLKTKPNQPTCLSVNLTSKVISLASSLCKHFRNARICDFRPLFSTGFPQSFPHRVFGGDRRCLGELITGA